ncbi:MAG TPA: BTAD domain-containing putative transcriptional regulator [Candidatus Binatia bacterium]|nr:BTAD domain-containing putative transcriptional regulator [Candidatus Binatia bacterium]
MTAKAEVGMEPTPVAKLLPPARPDGFIARAELVDRLATVLSRRLTVVMAEAGYGKSSLLSSWWEVAACAWYTADATDRDVFTMARRLTDALRLRIPELPGALIHAIETASGPEQEQPLRGDALGSRLAQALHEHLRADLMIVIDDVDELGEGSPSSRLVEALCRHAPPLLHLVLAGRGRPPFPVERLRGQGQLLEIGAEQLAFTVDEVAQLAGDRLGEPARGLAAELHQLAGGWPAAVILALEALRETPSERWRAVLSGPDRPHTPLFDYLAEEIFAHHPAGLRELVSRVAVFEQFTSELCTAVGIADSPRRVAELAGQSLLVESRPDGSLALRPLIRDYARKHLPLPAAETRRLRVDGAGWLAAHGAAGAALRLLLAAGEPEPLADVLALAGTSLLAAGHVAAVLDACRALPSGFRSAAIEQLEGEARQIQGDWSGAQACFERAAAGAGQLPARLAWRIGLLHYLRGRLGPALEVYQRGLSDAAAEPVEMALLLGWTATAHWLRGEVEPSRRLASQALATATACADARALAAAHTVMAMLAALDGDRRANDAHYLLALRSAEEAGDLLQLVRIRTNRASHFLEEGSYPEALEELEVAVRLAEVTSYASFLALSLCNRGETKLRIGRLDEALADLEASRSRYQEIGSDMVAYPLALIGEVYRERGNLAQARASFEEAASIAQASGDEQGLVPALAGLATVIAGEEPDQARRLTEQALARGGGLAYVTALLAAGWVAAAAGDLERAGEMARAAGTAARTRRERAGLAEALSLAAVSAGDRRRSVQHLRDAAEIWRELGNPLGEARVELALGTLDPGPGAEARRRDARHRLEALGVHDRPGGGAAGLMALLAEPEAAVRIESLGGFSVVRGGQPVKASEWQSKRARDLLKLLVARRGRPASRGYLMDTLWPDEGGERVSNRLSVALTTVRGVLDPRRASTTEPILADKDAVALNLAALDVDLEAFMSAAEDGLRQLRRGDADAGIRLLERAAAMYSGDFLEENPYDDWAVPAREEARATYVAVARGLASHAARRAEPDAAIPHLLRILEIDLYDERAHLELVTLLADAGRHGEAHRHYRRYRQAMDDLGVEPAAFPGGRAASVAPIHPPGAPPDGPLPEATFTRP